MAALAKFYDQKLSWSACGGGFQCTKVKVPVDYEKPDGATLNHTSAESTSTFCCALLK